jgi:hypothetical protein
VPEKKIRTQVRQNLPRGSSAGKQANRGEMLAGKAARIAGYAFDSLLAWKVYPDRVALIASDGSKHEVPFESILLEEV